VTVNFSIREAADRDLPQIVRLLERNALPTADLAISRPAFVVACDGPAVIGAGGLEVFGAIGLLRSVVVDDSSRGAGLGRALVESVERTAERRGVTELVLLTETAHDFFANLGYADIARDAAPRAVRESAEFKALCPQSARCMSKRIGG
jgi:N-acetylglutamate synthase-like GNAT family acetyltransferase